MPRADEELDRLRRQLVADGPRFYVGLGSNGLAFTERQQALLILGPPRSGKTTSLVIPNVSLAPGPVVSTSTKPDVMNSTLATRSPMGRCWLFDPTGTVTLPPGVTALRWSPVTAARDWDDSLVTARAMVAASRPSGWSGDSTHWTERAEALLAPLLHAAALNGADMRTVVGWVFRQELDAAQSILNARSGTLAADVLAGLAATDPRELSGIWSTAAGVLGAYRSEATLDAATAPNLDPTRLAGGTDTIYICAPARHQTLVAPLIVAFLEQIRAGAYANAARGVTTPPVTLALDEVANIAPLPDLPAMVSEGGGQGVATLACLQDLSQARQRWGRAAEGFLSLFGAKVILPGIGDLATLELVSRLAGEIDVPTRSLSQGPWWSQGRAGRTVTWSVHRQRRLPVDTVNQLAAGSALLLNGGRAPSRVRLSPWWSTPPFAPPPPQRTTSQLRLRPPGRGIET